MVPEAFYLVLDYGKRGRESIINWDACSKRDVIDTIKRGDYRGLLTEVHCIDREGGRWSDASEDIAREILDGLDTPPSPELFEFLERQLGSVTMMELREAAE